jgi:hypothetical protein
LQPSEPHCNGSVSQSVSLCRHMCRCGHCGTSMGCDCGCDQSSSVAQRARVRMADLHRLKELDVGRAVAQGAAHMPQRQAHNQELAGLHVRRQPHPSRLACARREGAHASNGQSGSPRCRAVVAVEGARRATARPRATLATAASARSGASWRHGVRKHTSSCAECTGAGFVQAASSHHTEASGAIAPGILTNSTGPSLRCGR